MVHGAGPIERADENRTLHKHNLRIVTCHPTQCLINKQSNQSNLVIINMAHFCNGAGFVVFRRVNDKVEYLLVSETMKKPKWIPPRGKQTTLLNLRMSYDK